ncbi:MAG: NAD-dependent epimerase/dehydratase family protein, partial [Anaerolineae bacterium]|nr:NAD-dependent epimerase/dehydratase family protein [Anaerolineae bacterium]
VLHVAAKAGMWGSYQDFYLPNVRGTENILAACQQLGIPRLVFTSSPSVIDHNEPIEGGDESLPYPAQFVSHYSATKALAEQMVLAANSPALATVAIRPPLIWGPGDTQFMPRFIQRARQGRLLRVGAGEYLADTTYIDNAAAAHLLALDRLAPDAPIAGRVYFISNDEPRPVHTMINGMISAAGFPPMRITVPKGAVNLAAGLIEGTYKALQVQQEPPVTRFLVDQLTKSRWFNISAAKRDLGYVPQVSIDEGLSRLATHWQEHTP